MGEINAIPIRSGKRQHYRIFDDNGNFGGCIHIEVEKKYWGISIHAHCDLEEHGDFEFNKDTLRIMSELYVWLKRNYGDVVMVPREELKFQGLIGRSMINKTGKPNKRDITKIKKYKRKPHFW